MPGDTVSYTVSARAVLSGTGQVISSMDADSVPGTTLVKTNIRVLQGGPVLRAQ